MGIMSLSSKWWLGALVIFIVAHILCSMAGGTFVTSGASDSVNGLANMVPTVGSTPMAIWNFVYNLVTWDKYKVLNDGTTITAVVKLILVVVSLTVVVPFAFIILNFIRSLIPFTSS